MSERLSEVLSEEEEGPLIRIQPKAIFGINGSVEFGLRLHPDKEQIVFPLGIKIGIANMTNNKQEFVTGHTHSVSCMDFSRDGKYLASGQINHMGFRAYVIVWDFEKRSELARHDLHKVRVQSLCFTAENRFVISIGGPDDGSVIVFDMKQMSPICRAVASTHISGFPTIIVALHNNMFFFIVAGDRHLRMWSLIREQKKLNVTDVNLGKHTRRFTKLCIDKRDEYIYLGTMTGDVVKVSINCCDLNTVTRGYESAVMMGAYGKHNPRKPYGKDCERYVNGVRDLHIVADGLLLLGTGDGTIELVEERPETPISSFKKYPNPTWPMFRTLKNCKVNGAITSLVPINTVEFYICTELNEVYKLNIKTFDLLLLKTCHQRTVANIVFPKGLSTLFASCGHDTVRIWSTVRLQELLRIIVHNFFCAGVVFSYDGSCLISVWDDGVIRAFTPITGRLIYAIPNAHNKGCSAVAISRNGRVLVSGGVEGQVRVWKIEVLRQSLVVVMKDHSGPVSSLDFNNDDTELISACVDGSCVIWDMKRMNRKQVISANTQFFLARYVPSADKVLTCGADGRIGYWLVYNGALIREVIASNKSAVNYFSIHDSGNYFASVGNDTLVKIWDFHRGVILGQGSEHASIVKSVAYSPNGKFVVSGSEDGCIIIWDIPQAYWGDEDNVTRTSVPHKSSFHNVLPKVITSSRAVNQKKENVDGLLASTPKGYVACIECPEVVHQKKPANGKCGAETKI